MQFAVYVLCTYALVCIMQFRPFYNCFLSELRMSIFAMENQNSTLVSIILWNFVKNRL